MIQAPTPSQPHQPHSLIVADIHLQPEESHPINQAFIQFLNNEATQADALYILGDLFEMWVGDDVGMEMYAQAITNLKKLVDKGVAVYLQYGNRDFLMREQFCQCTGVKLLQDIEIVELYQHPYLLLHGDTLCTDDKGYQRMRSIVRNAVVQWIFLHLCRKRRLKIAQKMRQSSKAHSQNKSSEIMDVNQDAVMQLFKKHPNITHMIHGHTHRPAHHIIESEAKTLNRWVLGDWRPEAKIIKITQAGPELLDYSIQD